MCQDFNIGEYFALSVYIGTSQSWTVTYWNINGPDSRLHLAGGCGSEDIFLNNCFAWFWYSIRLLPAYKIRYTVKILSFGTDMHGQTVQTLIRHSDPRINTYLESIFSWWDFIIICIQDQTLTIQTLPIITVVNGFSCTQRSRWMRRLLGFCVLFWNKHAFGSKFLTGYHLQRMLTTGSFQGV